MDLNSQKKIREAGFTIIRKDNQPNIRIKYVDRYVKDWRTLEVFHTKKARDERFTELLKSDLIIQD